MGYTHAQCQCGSSSMLAGDPAKHDGKSLRCNCNTCHVVYITDFWGKSAVTEFWSLLQPQPLECT
eukprot:1213577-Amphidinium_carterae.1